MLIKEKAIKNYAVLERVLRYILAKEAEHGFVHTKYISKDRKYAKELSVLMEDAEAFSIINEERLQNMLVKYIQNDKGRVHKRHNETKFHHSIISFHKKDVLSQQDLLRVSKEFIKRRYPKSIVCSVSHHDKQHMHLHLIGSHVQVGTGITNYHTKKQFSEVKQYMEQWQQQELDLKHSNIQHVKKKIKF